MKIAPALPAVSLMMFATAAAAQDAELSVLDYAGFENPAFHAGYVETHGMSPTFSFFGDEDEAFQKVRSGFQTDLTHICGGSIAKWTESGLIAPWDASRIEAFADLDAALIGKDFDPDEPLYFVPVDWGSTAIAYNPEQVSAEDVASLSVFHNPAFAGRMTIPDNLDDAWALAYLATGVTDWSDVTDEQFNAAADWLRAAHANMRTYWTDTSELAQLMSTGEVLVAWAWNEIYPTMVEEGRAIAFEREPAEGSSVWLCGMVRMANAPGSEDKAYDYINALLAPSSTVPLLEAGFGTSNETALNAQVSAEELEASGLGEVSVPLFAQISVTNAHRERHAETFEMIKAGF